MAARQSIVVGSVLLGLLLIGRPAAAQEAPLVPKVSYPLQFSVSPLVREMPLQARSSGPPQEIHRGQLPARTGSTNVTDPVVQGSTPTPAAAQTLGNFEGMGAGYPGFSVTAVPPDPNGAVGPNHYVQWVNNAFVVFNKQGVQVQAPVADSTFWGGLTSTCDQGGGFSDPIVQYDRTADRWLVGEVALPLFAGLIGQYAQCFAVSTTSDPTGTYYMWAYGFGTNVNDYDKIAVWADAYYITWNIFQNGSNFIGAEACGFDRNAMLSGAAAPALVCFQLSSTYASLLPSDLDGATGPPAGSPNFFMNVDPGSGALNLWKFHADFTTPSNSTFTGPTSIPGVAAFTAPCPNTQDCIPQPGTTQSLDAIGDRLMHRLAYRNFGDHESIVANHTVLAPGGNTGVRWYEIRDPNGAPTIYQQGSFAPDTDSRWMASIAMDQVGNLAVGYSVSSSATYPSIRYTGWEVGNTLGALQAETSLVAGGGSQTGSNRWGDYSAMRIDPSDDCTFWYTQEYQATSESADWNTRIGSFKFPSCGQVLTSTATALASTVNPSTYGTPVTFTATVTPSSGPTGSVTFKDGLTIIGTQPLSGGQASYQTSSLLAGTHSITAVYGGDANFGASTSAVLTQTVSKANSTTTIASNNNPSIFGQNVTLRATVSPSGATGTVQFFDGATLLGAPTLSSGTASLSISTLSTGSHSITATYSGDAHYATSSSSALSQVVNQAPRALLSVTLSPTSVIGTVSTTANKVTMSGPVSVDTVVNLFSSNPGVTVPPSVTVAAGSSVSPGFPIATSLVSAPTLVTISASFNGVSKTATLTVNPFVATPVLSPTSLVGGVSSNANKVTLNAPAPAGGIIVNLTSSDPGVGLPASVTVAAGATASPVFTITTSSVAAIDLVTISATYNRVTKTAILMVNPVALVFVTLSPPSVAGGVSTTLNKVSLNGPAPAGGISVNLISSNPGVGVPASVTVAAGALLSPYFTITTSAVAAQTVVTISASYNGVTKTANLTVNPVALLSVALSPASVVGGVSSKANKVTLNAPAPAGGVIVNLTSSDPGVGLPASVTVAAGATASPVFTITTSSVSATDMVTISATYNNVTKTAILTVNPVALVSVTLSPASVVGGVSTTLNKVSLNGPAPAGGISVNLISSTPGVGVPASVTVAAGALSSPYFTITTSAVAAQTVVTISASYNGVTKTANLTVNP